MGLPLAPDIAGPRPYVPMATMAIIRMRAHLTDTMVLRGSSVVSSSVPARGITATMDPVSIDRALMLGGGTARALTRILAMATITAADMLIAAQLRMGRLAAASARAPAVSTAARVADPIDIADRVRTSGPFSHWAARFTFSAMRLPAWGIEAGSRCSFIRPF